MVVDHGSYNVTTYIEKKRKKKKKEQKKEKKKRGSIRKTDLD